MEFAFNKLGWTPDTFWNCSVIEMQCILKQYNKTEKNQYIQRSELEKLVANFPD